MKPTRPLSEALSVLSGILIATAAAIAAEPIATFALTGGQTGNLPHPRAYQLPPTQPLRDVAVKNAHPGATHPGVAAMGADDSGGPPPVNFASVNATGAGPGDDFVPEQFAGFRWDPITGNPKVGDQIPVRLTAVDGGGNPVTNFSGTVHLMATATGRRPTSVVITEVNPTLETLSQVEFGNVSTNDVDLSHWRVWFYDSTTWPLPRGSVTLDAGTSLPAAGVFRITEGTNSTQAPFPVPDLFPNLRSGFPLEWGPSAGENGRHIAVLLQDSTGAIVDFFCGLRALPDQIKVPVAIPADEWVGLPMVEASSPSLSYQRTGNSDTNSAADWATWGPSVNQFSPLMQVPYEDSRALPMTPDVATEFRDGVWTGSLRLDSFTPRVAFLAAVGNGHWEHSPQFSMGPEDNISVTLAVSPTQGYRIRDYVGYRAEVTHCCGGVSSNVVVEIRLPIQFGPQSFLADVRMSQGTHEATLYSTTGIGTLVRARFGDLAPGQTASVEFAVLPRNSLSLLGMPTNLVATAKVTRTQPETNVADDSAEAVMEINTGCVRLPAGALAWWRGEQTRDDSLAGAALEIVGGNTNSPTYSPGRMEGAMSLTTDRGRGFQTGEGFQWNLGANRNFAVEFWMRTTSDILRDRIVLLDKRETASGVGFVLILDQGRLGVMLTDTDGKSQSHFTPTPTTNTPDLRDGRWHHLALSARRDPQTAALVLSVDGALTPISAQFAVTGDLGQAPLRIGFEPGQGDSTALVGFMDEITIYSTALETASLSEISRAGGAGKCLADIRLAFAKPELAAGQLPAPLSYGRPLAISLTVTNHGPLAIPSNWIAVVLGELGSVRLVTPSVGTNVFNPFVTYHDFGPLAAGASRSVEAEITLTNILNRLYPELAVLLPYLGQGYRMTSPSVTFRINPDGDADELPDVWELSNGYDPLDAADATADTDEDGFRNVDEYLLGTNPRSAEDQLKIELISLTEGGVQIRFAGKKDKVYGLFRRDTLGADWTEVARRAAADNSMIDLSDAAPGASSGFYRIQLITSP